MCLDAFYFCFFSLKHEAYTILSAAAVYCNKNANMLTGSSYNVCHVRHLSLAEADGIVISFGHKNILLMKATVHPQST